MRHQIIKNVGSNYIATLIGMVLGLFLIPFLIQKLGREAFGLIVLVESTIALFEVSTIGIKMALSRYATFALAKGNTEEFQEYLSTGRGLLIVVAVPVLIASCFLGLNFPTIFKVPSELVSESRVLFLLVALGFSITIPSIVFWSVLYAKQRFDLINTVLFSGLVLRAIGVFILYSILPDRYVSLVTYGFVYLAMMLLQNQLIYYWQKRIMPDVHIRLSKFKLSQVFGILSFGFHTSVSRVSALLSTNFMDLVINIYWGPAFNAMYSVGSKFSTLMNRLFQDTTWTLTPSFTELVAQKDFARLKKLLFVYTKFISILVVPLGLLLAWLAKPLIRVWLGEGFDLAATLLTILVIPLITAIPLAVTGCINTAYGNVKIPSRVAFLVAIGNVGMGVILGKYFGQGLIGIAIASAVASVIYYSLFAPFYACRTANISLQEYWLRSFLKPFAWSCSVIGAAAIAFQILGRGAPITLVWLVVFLMGLPLLCYVGAYFIVLSSEERSNVREAMQETASKFRWVPKRNTTNPRFL